MLDLLVNTIAVPFGYASELNETEVPCIGESFFLTTDMWTRDLRNPNGWSLLPDIIQSNTPPPSPLRRALSSSFVFPEKKTKAVQQSHCESQEEEEQAPKTETNLGRHQAQNPEPDDSLHQDTQMNRRDPGLPELAWRLPHLNRSPDLCQEALQQEGKRNGSPDIAKGVSQYTRLCTVGCDLRKIADQFEADNAQMNIKREEEVAFSLAVPISFSRCVSVSILFLIWWRLYNKFR